MVSAPGSGAGRVPVSAGEGGGGADFGEYLGLFGNIWDYSGTFGMREEEDKDEAGAAGDCRETPRPGRDFPPPQGPPCPLLFPKIPKIPTGSIPPPKKKIKKIGMKPPSSFRDPSPGSGVSFPSPSLPRGIFSIFYHPRKELGILKKFKIGIKPLNWEF